MKKCGKSFHRRRQDRISGRSGFSRAPAARRIEKRKETPHGTYDIREVTAAAAGLRGAASRRLQGRRARALNDARAKMACGCT